MDPSYIFFKEIDIASDQTFTADFSKKNEIEEIIFKEECPYGINGLSINVNIPDEKILKIENFKEQKKISEEIQQMIREYTGPNLTLFISNPETKTVAIPFVKKKMKVIYQK